MENEYNLFGELIIDETRFDYRDACVDKFAADNFTWNTEDGKKMYIFKNTFDYNELIYTIYKKTKKIPENFPLKDKLTYSLIRKYQIKRGEWTEKILKLIYRDKLQCNDLTIEGVTGDILCIDQDNIIHFYECKSSNELDKTKKNGEITAFKEKLEKIREVYPNNKIIATYFFRKETISRNTNKNKDFINYCKIDGNADVKVLYGNEIRYNIGDENTKLYLGIEQYLNDNYLVRNLKELINKFIQNKSKYIQ